jgi:hypothetical protein
MERLEAQLRRAADDLAETLAAARQSTDDPTPLRVVEPPDAMFRGRRRCGLWMPQAREACARLEGHSNCCRTHEAMETERLMRARIRGRA